MQKPIKAGFAVLVGRSNVGKSTLLNTLVGTKIAITTPKLQTTRHLIHGVWNDERGQIVFVDTPGIFKDKKSTLGGVLQERLKEALRGIDVILYVVDPTREIGEEEHYTLSLVRKAHIPTLLVINKIDIPKKPYLDWYQDLSPEFNATIEVSALKARNMKPLRDAVFSYLPEGQPFYPPDQLTNINKEQWVAELIREKVFLAMDKELPYTTTVLVDQIEEKKDILVIHARILTTLKKYKAMLIGEGGHKIKDIGSMARRELEQALNKKIFLEVEVEVNEKWVHIFET